MGGKRNETSAEEKSSENETVESQSVVIRFTAKRMLWLNYLKSKLKK